MLKRLLIVLSVLLTTGSGVANANIVRNADFAEGQVGWVFNLSPVSQMPPRPHDECIPGSCPGSFYTAVLNEKSGWYDPWDLCQCTVSQELATAVGTTYRVSYLLALQGGCCSHGNFDAWFGDVKGPEARTIIPIGQHNFNEPAREISFLVTASSAVSTLELGGWCPECDFFVSEVSVNAIPSPPTLPLILFGAVMLFSFRTIRRRC